MCLQAYPNLLLRLDETAAITECHLLPDTFPSQVRYGFEGVAEDGDNVVITVQRAWGGEAHPRLAIYNQATDTWKYAFYPLDAPESQYGGWVGLSDIAPIGDGQFLVLERDNQGGPDAAIKRIYQINLGDFSFEDGSAVEKVLVRDLYEDLQSTKGGIFEKVEGLAVTSSGSMWVNSDNDGIDDSAGEQLFMNVGEYTMTEVGEPVPPANMPETMPEEGDGMEKDEEEMGGDMDGDMEKEEMEDTTSGSGTAATMISVALGMSVVAMFGF